MEFISADGEQRYAALIRAADSLVVGLDFDGTLAPIVDDPENAHIHPDAGQVLADLVSRVRAVAVVTGRPARQALSLGGLDDIGDRAAAVGGELLVLGQYGNERWDSADRRVRSPKSPEGLVRVRHELPSLLERLGLDPWIEEKGLAIGVHTRRMADPQQAFDALLPAVTELAHEHGLQVEPGRLVIEVRAPGMDKGDAVRRLVADLDAGAFCFAGDDLADVEAFEAVGELGSAGMPTLLVCSGSEEEGSLVRLADLVVPGPAGVLDFLRRLATDIGHT